MKRIEEKVRDVVEVRNYSNLSNFDEDPAETVSGYHFTDITAALTAKWMRAAAAITYQGGAALALAGFRGVGKSHFLATFGALFSHPEVRGKITDPLVLSAAHELSRRSYTVISLRRGTRETLIEELKDAVSTVVGIETASLSDSPSDLLNKARECAGDLPLILLVDTAFERDSRVARDDGAVLSEFAENAKNTGIFVGIALDDDISGADGANLAISSSFSIDYLDQEHLYKIVDTHIFPKDQRMMPVLREIYEFYRAVVPGFRWSEERFRALYPIHPAIMELAPFVRLYLHDFALLSFASEAGARILGRPANSLIAPDEVFDKVEKGMRAVDELKDAFAAYDSINDKVISKIPVMTRLQAKLILKGLFLFSLKDDGATAAEIGASMLIFDESDPGAAERNIGSTLSSFAEARPDIIAVNDGDGPNRRFGFRLGGKDEFKEAVGRSAEAIDTKTVVDEVLKKLFEDRFSDCIFQEQVDRRPYSDCSVLWRGGFRRGRIVWGGDDQGVLGLDPGLGVDWVTAISFEDARDTVTPVDSLVPVVAWRPAMLRDNEIESLKRLCVLTSDAEIRSAFPAHVGPAYHAQMIAVENLMQRVFLAEAVISIEGFEYNFVENARAATKLSDVLGVMLEAFFEGRYPEHPHFAQPLSMKDVGALVSDLFGGLNPGVDQVQSLARTFGLPLGIVTEHAGGFVPADDETLRRLPHVASILSVVAAQDGQLTPFKSIFEIVGTRPNGFVRESTYLLLAAMVSGRLLEFVTSNGDRINHRSLDLQIIWDDIVGVAMPGEPVYTNERLLSWAALFIGKNSFASVAGVEDRAEISDALVDWLEKWKERALAARFDMVGDGDLTTYVWGLARTSIKAFRSAADAIALLADGSVTLEVCLRLIADAFSDSESEITRCHANLAILEDFLANVALRREIISWVSLCEPSDDAEIDGLRVALEAAIESALNNPGTQVNLDIENLWSRYKRAYSSHYLERHDALLATPSLREKLKEILKTDLWWEFYSLSDLEPFDPTYRVTAHRIVTRIKELDCKFDPRDVFARLPICGCGFSISEAGAIDLLPDELWKIVNQGLVAYRSTLRRQSADIIGRLKQMGPGAIDDETRGTIRELADHINATKEFRRFSDDEIRILRHVLGDRPLEAGPGRQREDGPEDPGLIEAPAVIDLSDVTEDIDAMLETMPA